MAIEIRMPALSPTMTEGNLASWQKSEGDTVEPGDVIAEIETDKATMEVEAVDEGTLGKIVVPAGTEAVPVNTVIAWLLEEGEDASAIESTAASAAPAVPAAAAPEPEAAAPAPRPVAGNGADRGNRIFASPLARRMAQQAGLDLATIAGSGPHGRVVKADIEKALAAGKAAPAKPAAPAPAAAAPAPAGAPAEPHTEIQLSNMRKVIARRLTEAKQTIPHFYLTIDCRLDALLALRKDLNAREGADYKLSVNDFVIKATALGLRDTPDANASWGGDRIYRFENCDVSVAVAIDGGLITPIVRRADQKGLATISSEMKDLAARARDGKLMPEEYQGGGFTVSNLGMFGIKEFSAVINPPQSCILAIGAGEQRPVVKDGALATATMMTCTLSVDHRAVDGALGARFLAAFKGYIEDPISLIL